MAATGDINTMKHGQCTEPGKFEIVEKSAPTHIPDGWVLIDIAAVGICGTDYHIYGGNQPFLNYPRVIGHELSGHVAADAAGWSKGDLVVINPYLSCGTCHACKRGKPNCCMAIEVLGVHRDGGLCEQIAVPASNLIAATGLTALQAAMVEFLAVGAHAVRRSRLSKGDKVLVVGVGPIGIGAALFARLAGGDVHLLDASEERLEMARKDFGFEKQHLVGEDMTAAPHSDGFDVVFDATGNPSAIEAGFKLIAHGGTYVLISVVKGKIAFEDSEFHKREMQLLASRNALDEDFQTVMEALRSGTVDSDALLSRKISLDAFAESFGDLAQSRDNLIKVIVDMSL